MDQTTTISAYCQEDLIGGIANDYDKGILHLVWLVEKHNRRLIFAQFELYPQGYDTPEESIGLVIQRPDLAGKLDPREQCIRLPDGRLIFYIRVLNNASDLLKLYKGLGETGQLPLFWLQGDIRCVSGPLAFAPSWPYLTLSRYENRNEISWTWPYIPQGWGDVRCQHCFAQEPAPWLSEILLYNRPASWLRDRLGWDISQYPDLWGSSHLTLPNPLYRTLHVRAVPPEAAHKNWQIHCELTGKIAEREAQLVLHFLQRGASGILSWPSIQLELPIQDEVYLEIPDEPDQLACIATSPGRGLLSFEPFTGFIKKIITNLGIRQKGIVRLESSESFMQVQRDAFEAVAEFAVENIPTLNDWGARITSRQTAQAEKNDAKKSGEEWFDNEKEARARIAEILRPAKTVLIVDPYFCKHDLLDYVVASCNANAEITILTSRKAFGSKIEERLKSAKEVFELVCALNKGGGWKIKILVMSKNPPVHDRFLILNNETVWYSGASLNHIGSKGCIIDKLHDPTLVRDKISGVLASRGRVKNLEECLGEGTSDWED